MKKTLVALITLLLAGSALALAPGTDLFVPSVTHANGAPVDGVQPLWRSDLWIFNPSTTTQATVDIFLLLRGQANVNPSSRAIPVAPGETRYLQDLLLQYFGTENVSGALHITSAVPVVVTGVTYDANVQVVGKGTGSAGQFFAATPADSAIGVGSFTDIIGLDQDGAGTTGAWRSNLSLVETTGNTLNLEIERLDNLGGVVATLPAHLDPFEAMQLNNVLTTVTPTPGSNQRIRVRATLGEGRFVAAASRVNNASGDPSTVEMTATHAIGRFQGLLLAGGGTAVDGGIQIQLGNATLASFKGVAGIPCGDTVLTVELSSNPSAAPVALNADGSFSTLVSIPYSDEGHVAFTTDWTLAGAPNTDGTWSGTLLSNTHGGSGDFATCNAPAVSRQWQAGWTGGS
jgi:hypothetical protein